MLIWLAFTGGPIPLPKSHNSFRKSGTTTLRIQNPELGAQLFSVLTINGQCFDFHGSRDQDAFNEPLAVGVSDKICVPPGEALTICARFRLVPSLEPRKYPFDPLHTLPWKAASGIGNSRWKNDELSTTYVLRRNVEYVLANCVIPVSETSVAVITDHIALPLGWNRDNYYQIRLLQATYANIHELVDPQFARRYEVQIKAAARGHLQWVFNTAERPHGFWHRSYLINGRPKDHCIFQLDQQCYPILEVCDHLDHFPDDFELVKRFVSSGVVQEVLHVLKSKRDSQTGLYSTEETPGDDAVDDPFHLSSHILLWRTLMRLQNLFAHLNLPGGDQVHGFDEMAAELRLRTLRSFTATHPSSGKRMFAYLTDGHGKVKFYHDANDIPTLFAREWGFVSTRNEVLIWKNTMDFGFSPDNEAGYCSDGVYGGLGSVHTPGAWTLGYFQELAYAALLNNASAMQVAWTKITAAMQWDGTFSEAVNANTAECTSKAWFSWPGAMIGALIINMRMNGQERVLLGRA